MPKKLELLCVVASFVCGVLVCYFVDSWLAETASVEALAVATIDARKSDYGSALEAIYSISSKDTGIQYQAMDLVGDMYYCMGDMRAAVVNYKLAIKLAEPDHVSVIISNKVSKIRKRESGAAFFPSCGRNIPR